MDRSRLFLCIASQMRSSVGAPSPRSWRVDLVSSRLILVRVRLWVLRDSSLEISL